MSYAQRKELTGNRTFSIVMTAAVVGGLMYAIVTGLAYQVIKKTAEDLKVVDIEQPPPPPPEEPPPPPKDMPKVPPPPMTPPPVVRINTPEPPIRTVEAPPVLPPVAPPVMSPPRPPAPPAPAPAPRKVQSAQSSKGDLRGLFTGDDYPAAAMSSGAEGTAQAQLTIGADGRVTGCNIIRSAGNGALDSATCNILRRRAKFTPARDSNGNATTDTITTPPITWRLEG
ncbi:MAG TPA: TonB family protein [Sphingomicrobium sp.]|jgi:protein TonB